MRSYIELSVYNIQNVFHLQNVDLLTEGKGVGRRQVQTKCDGIMSEIQIKNVHSDSLSGWNFMAECQQYKHSNSLSG